MFETVSFQAWNSVERPGEHGSHYRIRRYVVTSLYINDHLGTIHQRNEQADRYRRMNGRVDEYDQR